MAILFSTNFDADTVGQLPSGWTAALGSWSVGTDAPVSGARDLRSTSAAQFDTVLRTGTADASDDVVTYRYRWKDKQSQACPVFRCDASFARGYVANFEVNSGVSSNFLWFKRANSDYGAATNLTFTAPTFAVNDVVAVERKSTGGVHEFRIWNATTGSRPNSATVSFTQNDYTTGYSGIFNAASTTPGFDDYVYSDQVAAGQSIGRANAAITYAPYVWDDNGTAKVANTQGAYLTLGFTGTSIAANITALTGLSRYPVVRASIDNGPPIDVAITAGATTLTLATGLSAGSHTLRLTVLRIDDASGGRWSTTNALKIVGFTIDQSATVSPLTKRSKTMTAFGDSLFAGVRVGSASDFVGDDATATIPVLLAEALDAELGLIGFGGSAFAAAGVGDNPALTDSYDKYSSGRSRLTGGVISPAPDYALCMYGTNPVPGNATQAQVATAIANFRTVMPTTWLFMIVPPGGFSRAGITAATNAAIAAGDTKLKLIDFGDDLSAGLTAFGPENAKSYDGIHLKAVANATLAARAALGIQHAVEPRRFTVIAA